VDTSNNLIAILFINWKSWFPDNITIPTGIWSNTWTSKFLDNKVLLVGIYIKSLACGLLHSKSISYWGGLVN
jgi:hypothetical protein